MPEEKTRRWLGIGPGPNNPVAGGGAAPTYTISGTIQDANSTPNNLEGVTVTLTGDASDSTSTAAGGTYSFTVEDGSYTVTPTKAGWTFTPTSSAVTVSGSNQTGKDFVGVTFEQVVWNTEGISIGTTDMANVSYQLPSGGAQASSVQLDSYDTMADIVGSPARDLTKGFQFDGGGANPLSVYLYLGVGNGFTPSGGKTVRAEAVVWSDGVTPWARLGILSEDGQDGLRIELSANTLYIATSTGGSFTTKGTHGSVFSSQPHGICWYRISFEYDFSDNGYEIHVRELGSVAAAQEAVTKSGTVSSPTFGSGTELHKVYVKVTNNSETCGASQITVSDETTAFPDAYKKTSNFTP